tara:strand:- start:1103 stop:1330 length:228 start_codon:yes stop_codon:yes gene_type:complete
MAKLENPPTLKTPLIDAVRLARKHPGRWVLAQTYAKPETAGVTGAKIKKKQGGRDLETRVAGRKLYFRVQGVENK